ncbi:SocA family protein [Pseudoalteromonas sp. SR45-6]|uniref:Panacea domain-containing protein n=1 Tax=Pseudoalteromonas sp. SR45-6 TaxID=2760927 RepID=UPI001601AF81|nr:type II toxin-antitoxin system antitoxin SocA domain-containing protein [Pseudoalteromonas sp. SR45-6]MBB1341443.1 SocA family protein [Pseudoalteromonas sp. SR45-6]
MISANQVADFFLAFAKEHGDYISQLKLQKMVYYADAWFLVNNGKALINEDFEAWVHGPVVRSLYHRFKEYRSNPILEDVNFPELDGTHTEHLIDIYDVFGKFSGYQLEQMTHDEQPWIEARGSCAPDEACENIIDKETTLKFYTKVADEV